MKKKHGIMAAAALVMAAALLLWAGNASAVHLSGEVWCSGCHTMHATNLWYGTGSAGKLTKAPPGSGFCLECHDEEQNSGTTYDTTPPFVSKGNTGTSGKPSTVGAAGYFYGLQTTDITGANGLQTTSPTGWTSANGHDLEVTTTPPISSTAITGFGCDNCHNHHGTRATASSTGSVSFFRNLNQDPNGDSTKVTLIGAENTGYTNTEYYGGFADWCIECHEDYTPKDGGVYHPVDVTISATTLGTNYEYGMDDLALTTLDHTGQPIIKPEDPIGTDAPNDLTPANRDPGDDDQVTCLTCHYAHGGPYANMLRWDYGNGSFAWNDVKNDTGNLTANSAGDAAAGCQICHNK